MVSAAKSRFARNGSALRAWRVRIVRRIDGGCGVGGKKDLSGCCFQPTSLLKDPLAHRGDRFRGCGVVWCGLVPVGDLSLRLVPDGMPNDEELAFGAPGNGSSAESWREIRSQSMKHGISARPRREMAPRAWCSRRDWEPWKGDDTCRRAGDQCGRSRIR